MPIIEIDTLQRVRDMTYKNGTFDTQFRVARIASVEVDGQSYLLMSGEISGLAVALIEPNGGLNFVDAFGTGPANLIDAFALGAGFTTHPSVTAFESGGVSYAYVGSTVNEYSSGSILNQFSAVTALQIDDAGHPDFVHNTKLVHVPGGGGAVSSFGSDPQITTVGKRDILITPEKWSSSLESTFETFLIRSDGSLKSLASTQPFTYGFKKFDTVHSGGNTFVVAFGQYDIAPLQVLRLNERGKMKPVFELPTSDTAIFNRITTDIETVEIGARSFVIVSEVTNGSVLVYEIQKSGRLSLVEQESPTRLEDSWSSPEALEVFEQGGNQYVAAGGYGRGLAVFQISDGGALTEVDEFLFDDPGIRFVYDLETRDLAKGQQYIFASTATEDEVRSFRFVPMDDSIVGGGRRRKGTDQDDQIFGLGGSDILKGLEGDDLIEGGKGNDRVLGGDGEDNLYGNGGRDILRGGEGYDFLFGDAGADRLFGEDGNDYADGGSGDDVITGDAGNDRLFGARGDDTLDGGGGNDVLTDGAGKDTLTGGTGNDVFVFLKDRKRDVIADFEENRDKIDMTEFGPGLEFSDLAVRQSGNNVVVSFGKDSILVKAADGEIFDFELSLGDFVFA